MASGPWSCAYRTFRVVTALMFLDGSSHLGASIAVTLNHRAITKNYCPVLRF